MKKIQAIEMKPTELLGQVRDIILAARSFAARSVDTLWPPLSGHAAPGWSDSGRHPVD
jgi:hypothetical protein